jgi:membrane protein DedA with SNARE-associated domain
MKETFEFLLEYGYLLLFATVLAEQLGLPIPSTPVLLAAGALAGRGDFSFGLLLALAVTAAVLSDIAWYYLGRSRGHHILRLLCRISLEPDTCVRRTEGVFWKQGAKMLLYAKFVPVLNTTAPPLAGVVGMPVGRFLIFDLAGSIIWVGAFAGAGYIFSDQLEFVAAIAARLGGWLAVLLVAGLAGYILYKYLHRRKFIRELRTARITVEELNSKMVRGEQIVVIDLRHDVELDVDPVTIPGALKFSLEDLAERHAEIPKDFEVALFCT